MKTPQLPAPELAAALGIPVELWLKREDLHRHGSHKGRSIPLMIDEAAERQGLRHFVISSSGNAALSAIISVRNHNKSRPADPYYLQVYIGHRLGESKLGKLQKAAEADPAISINQVERPKQEAFQTSKQDGVKWLRQSTDETALRGYLELAKEIGRIHNLAAVFLPASSGTTLVGLAQGFAKLGLKPQLHAVQTPTCHPLIDELARSGGTCYASSSTPEVSSTAGAIADLVAFRQAAVAEAIIASGGAGWIVGNEAVAEAQAQTKKNARIDVSPNGALGLAALGQAQKNHWPFTGPVAVIITGE